ILSSAVRTEQERLHLGGDSPANPRGGLRAERPDAKQRDPAESGAKPTRTVAPSSRESSSLPRTILFAAGAGRVGRRGGARGAAGAPAPAATDGGATQRVRFCPAPCRRLTPRYTRH